MSPWVGTRLDRTEHLPEQQPGLLRASLQYFLKPRDALLNPGQRRCLEDGTAAFAQCVKVGAKFLCPTLRRRQCLSQRAAASALGDELDEVRDATLLRLELGVLDAHGLRDVGVQLPDFCLDAVKYVLQTVARREPLPHCIQDDALGEHSADQETVLARPLGRAKAAVVTLACCRQATSS